MADEAALMRALEKLRRLRRDRNEQALARVRGVVDQAQAYADQQHQMVMQRADEAAAAESTVAEVLATRPSLEDLRGVERLATGAHDAARAAQLHHFRARQYLAQTQAAMTQAQRDAKKALIQHEKVTEWQKNA